MSFFIASVLGGFAPHFIPNYKEAHTQLNISITLG